LYCRVPRTTTASLLVVLLVVLPGTPHHNSITASACQHVLLIALLLLLWPTYLTTAGGLGNNFKRAYCHCLLIIVFKTSPLQISTAYQKCSFCWLCTAGPAPCTAPAQLWEPTQLT
jgi:hypothetical protein